jgi:hypothetical protein
MKLNKIKMNKIQKIQKFTEENNKITYESEKILDQTNSLVRGQKINTIKYALRD